MPAWSLRRKTFGAGPDQEGRALLLGARRSEFRFPPSPGSPNHPWGQGALVVPDGRQVEVEEHEQIVERSPRSMWPRRRDVCTRMPHQTYRASAAPGWGGGGDTSAIIALADQLTRQGIERVVESTSDSWPGLSTCWKPVGCGVAGQRPRRPSRCRAGPDRQARCGVAGQAQRAGRLRPCSSHPPRSASARRHPAAVRPDQERARHGQRLEQLLEDA
jgi:hypothetical protein